MQIVVTGAAGGIGRKLCGSLAEAGHHIVALDRRYEPELNQIPRLEHRVVDLLDAVSVYPSLTGADALVHFGNFPTAHSAPAAQVYRENLAMNLHAFTAAVEVGVRKIVFASSVQVIEGRRRLGDDPLQPSEVQSLPLTGAAPPNPSNLYGLSKLAGEDLLRMMCAATPDLQAVALRLPYTSKGPTFPHPINLDDRRSWKWSRHTRLDDGLSWLDVEEVGPLIHAILAQDGPGYDCLMPASDDSHLGLPAEEIAQRFFPGVAVRAGLTGKFSLVDTSPITKKYGWQPANLAEYRDRDARENPADTS
ncbi:MAG: NAD(P)-dependent oxidoreductase [Planctomycetota bacterium]